MERNVERALFHGDRVADPMCDTLPRCHGRRFPAPAFRAAVGRPSTPWPGLETVAQCGRCTRGRWSVIRAPSLGRW